MKTMKKLWMAASVAAISMTGCQEEQFEGRPDPDNYYASVETFGTDTRKALGEGRSVVWSSEDRIAIFEGNGAGQAYQVLDAYVGKSSGEFAEVEGLVAEGIGASLEDTIAVYPFNEDLSVTSGNNGNYIIEGVTFPSVQKHIAGSFSDEAFPMTAICENGSKSLSFKNIGGVLKLSLTGSYSVSQITLTGNSGEPLSGSTTVTLGSDGIPSVTMSDDASTSVRLICDPAVQLDPDTATDFYISIPPTEFEAGFSVNITDSEGRNAIKNTEKQNNVCRSQILVMPAFAPPTHLFKENYYEDYDAYISEEGITMLSKKTEDGYEILIGHYDETEDSWNDNQFMIIHTDSLSRISDLYIENELLRFSNYSDNAVDILHIVGEDYELYEHIETPTTRSVLFATKSEGADADQGSETIDDLIKVIAGTKASFELAVNLVKHKGKIQTVLASINYISTAIPGLGGVALSEIQIGLEKKFLGRMPSFIEGELLLVEAVNVCVEKLSDILIGPWKITNTNVIVHTAESAIVNYTVSGIKSDPSINLSGSIGYRNVTKNDHFTNISIPVTNGTHQKSLTLSGPGDYILIIALNGTGGFLKRMQMHFTVPDYPMCQTGSAYNITTTSAVVDCTFSNIPEDGQCEVLLSWDDGHKIVNAENREGTQSITLSSLKPNTTYSYCASIDYEGGPVNGEMKEFTTKGDDCTLREQLIKLYNDTDGDNWTNNENWCSDRPIEEWYGINKLYIEDYYEINLYNNNLVGTAELNCSGIYRIYVYNNQLTALDLSGCASLEYLDCENNQLTSLDISGCTALRWLSCSYNQMISLDISGHTALEDLYCCPNYHLTSLNISGCTALRRFEYYDGQLTSLDVSGCTALTELVCSDGQLTSLDLSGCTALTKLSCINNQLTSLDVSGCTALTGLSCSYNQLTSLDVSRCTALTELSCSYNQLTSLDISGCTALRWLSCSGNQLTSLNISEYTALRILFCENNLLTSLDVSGCTSLEALYCEHNQLTSLDASGCTALERVDCCNNPLKSINLSGCSTYNTLSPLHIPKGISSLDLSGCTALEIASLQDYQLTSLNISGCTALSWLNCSNNQLTSLNVSGCTSLKNLRCKNNLISQEITPEYYDIEWFEYDRRYTNYWHEFHYDKDGNIVGCDWGYKDNKIGWWHPGEPESEHSGWH